MLRAYSRWHSKAFPTEPLLLRPGDDRCLRTAGVASRLAAQSVANRLRAVCLLSPLLRIADTRNALLPSGVE
jgi:hypothetical protein